MKDLCVSQHKQLVSKLKSRSRLQPNRVEVDLHVSLLRLSRSSLH